jgi:hypothetical protein
MPKLLIVSPGFAPANTPDSQRARLSLPHWRACGWEVEVLAVRGEDVAAPQEPDLLATIPGDLPIHRVRAWPIRLSRRLGFGSLAWRARRALRRAGDRVLSRGRFDLVFFSTSQFGVLPLGPRWLRCTGVPYVLDFQDPWVTDYYDRPGAPRPPGGWKYRLARRQALRDEPRCLRSAAGVVCVSPEYRDAFAARYPWFEEQRSLVLLSPAADADFARLAAEAGERSPLLPPDRKHIVAVGALGPPMRRSIEALCAACARLRREHPTAAETLRLHFIGTSYDPAGRPSALPLAQAAGIADLVEEQVARVRFFDALRWMRAGDALLALGSDDPGYVPSRLANLLWLDKPILAIAPPASGLASRLAGWHFCPVFAPDAVPDLAAWLRAFAAGGLPPRSAMPAAWREEQSSEGMTRRLAAFLRGRLAAAGSPGADRRSALC